MGSEMCIRDRREWGRASESEKGSEKGSEKTDPKRVTEKPQVNKTASEPAEGWGGARPKFGMASLNSPPIEGWPRNSWGFPDLSGLPEEVRGFGRGASRAGAHPILPARSHGRGRAMNRGANISHRPGHTQPEILPNNVNTTPDQFSDADKRKKEMLEKARAAIARNQNKLAQVSAELESNGSITLDHNPTAPVSWSPDYTSTQKEQDDAKAPQGSEIVMLDQSLASPAVVDVTPERHVSTLEMHVVESAEKVKGPVSQYDKDRIRVVQADFHNELHAMSLVEETGPAAKDMSLAKQKTDSGSAKDSVMCESALDSEEETVASACKERKDCDQSLMADDPIVLNKSKRHNRAKKVDERRECASKSGMKGKRGPTTRQMHLMKQSMADWMDNASGEENEFKETDMDEDEGRLTSVWK